MTDLALSPIQMDALKEVGNIGAGNAATALGAALNKTVNINVPLVKFITTAQFNEPEGDGAASYSRGHDDSLLKEPQDVSIAVFSRITETIKGGIMVLFSKKNSLLLSGLLTKKKPDTSGLLTLVEVSALSETSYILSCSYLDSVGLMLNQRLLIPSSPQTAIDKSGGLNKALIKRFLGEEVQYVMSIENIMTVDGREINLFIALLLEQESVQNILEMLGL